jgi:putative ABC transport system ATP-binding protein
MPSQLSGGEQQRVALARALVIEPSVVLADEPTGNLDSASADEVLQLLGRVHARGATIVMVTHSNEVAERAARVIRLADGRLVSDELVVRELAAGAAR